MEEGKTLMGESRSHRAIGPGDRQYQFGLDHLRGLGLLHAGQDEVEGQGIDDAPRGFGLGGRLGLRAEDEGRSRKGDDSGEE